MQSVSSAGLATRDGVIARLAPRRAHIGALLGASTIIAITAATAVPSSGPSSRAAAKMASPAPPFVGGALQRSAAPPIASDPTIRRFTGKVGPDLSRSLAAAGVPEQQGREYVALLTRAITLANGLSVDDRFDLILLRDSSNGSLGQLVYAGMDRVARADLELMKWTDGKHIIWINADGVGGDGSSAMRMPVQGRVSSGFGERFHPILGYARFHAGMDLAAAAGTPIVAAGDGKVVSAGWAGGYGRLVAIAHAGGIETKYGHMSSIVAFPGEIVHRGQLIGYVGSTGLSTGPHLHFEVMKNGRPVNPMSVKTLGGGAGQLEGAKLVAFQGELRKLLLGSAS